MRAWIQTSNTHINLSCNLWKDWANIETLSFCFLNKIFSFSFVVFLFVCLLLWSSWYLSSDDIHASLFSRPWDVYCINFVSSLFLLVRARLPSVTAALPSQTTLSYSHNIHCLISKVLGQFMKGVRSTMRRACYFCSFTP